MNTLSLGVSIDCSRSVTHTQKRRNERILDLIDGERESEKERKKERKKERERERERARESTYFTSQRSRTYIRYSSTLVWCSVLWWTLWTILNLLSYMYCIDHQREKERKHPHIISPFSTSEKRDPTTYYDIYT